jgi:hypothetical protein
MGDLQGLNGATVGFSAVGGPKEATEEEDMRGCEGCARRWPKSGLSWGCARPRRWRRGESLHHAAHVTKARPPNLGNHHPLLFNVNSPQSDRLR